MTTEAPPQPGRFRARLLGAAVLVILLAVYWMLAVSAVRDKSVTFDELACLTAGYSYWTTGDYRLQPENGTLEQRWAALPLLWGDYHFPRLLQASWWNADVFAIGQQFFYGMGNDADAMLLRGRQMVALLGAGLGMLVFLWSFRWFGWPGGFVSLWLYTFCPTLLAHGSLVTSDLVAAFFFTAAVGALWMVLHRITPLTVAASCLSLTALVLSKNSSLMLLVMGGLLLLVRLAGGRPLLLGQRHAVVVQRRLAQGLVLFGLLALHLAVVWGLVWAAFDFRYAAFAEVQPARDRFFPDWDYLLKEPTGFTHLVVWMREQRVLPEAYLYGLAHTERFARARNAFFNGAFSTDGWLGFFPYCLAVKTPLAFFGLLALAGIATAARWRSGQVAGSWTVQLRSSLYRAAPLWILLLVYWAFALSSHLNIGQRHLLPTYPAMFILAGAAGTLLRRARPRVQGVGRSADPSGKHHPFLGLSALLFLALFAVDSLCSWPNYLSYFNSLAGGSANGYRHLVDSSLDWGQDLPGLHQWLERQGLDAPVYLSYFGTGDPDYYGIRARILPSYLPRGLNREPSPLTGGVYCISATMLQGVYLFCPGPWNSRYETEYGQLAAFLRRYEDTRATPDARQALLRQMGRPNLPRVFQAFEQLRFARLCAFLRQREPDHQIGHSILIYRTSDADIERALAAATE
jgi:hypothetical protein